VELGLRNTGETRNQREKENTMADLEGNKKTVVAFFTRAFNDHEPEDAVAKYVGSQYIQHNPDTPDGSAAFIEATKRLIAQSPGLSVEIKRVIAEGNLVVTHDLVRRGPNDRGLAGIDIFRLENGKIVEHWDARQAVPEKAANNNTMF
jgi:predicted SnoaL-like aldol condensation-catalyzing enzyme